MADILSTGTSGYQLGAIDTATPVVDQTADVPGTGTAIAAKHPNGLATAIIQIQTILGVGPTLKGTLSDLATRLAVFLQASGLIKDKDGATVYSKYDGWVGYDTTTLRKLSNMASPGDIKPWSFTAIQTGWLNMNGQQVTCLNYEDLFDLAKADLDLPAANPVCWRRGTAHHTIAQATDINTGADTITKNAHGLSNGAIVHLSSSSTIPTGLITRTKYYIKGATTNTYQLSLTNNGSTVDITAIGSGTMSIYTTFQLPDWQSRSLIGVGQGSGLTNKALATAYGSEDVMAHSHIQRLTSLTVGSSATINAGSAATTGFASGGPTSPTGTGTDNLHPVVGVYWVVRY